MRLSTILGADEVAEAAFKRDSDGWLFQTPPMRGLFGLARAYRVSDARKAALKADYLKTYMRALLTGLMLIPVAIAVFAHGISMLPMVALVATSAWLLSLAFWVPYFRRLKRELANDVPAEGRITYLESVGTVARTMSMGRAIAFALVSALLLTGACFAYASDQPIQIVGILLFGFTTLYFTGIVVMKLRAKPDAS